MVILVLLSKPYRNEFSEKKYDEDRSFEYSQTDAQKNNRMLCCAQISSIDHAENTSTTQTDAYDVIRGSENPSPKSCDSQFSVEDKVIYKIYVLI